MIDDMMDFNNQVQKEHGLKYAEYERLRAEPPKGVKVGDRVLVAVGFLGHGFHWIRKECVVLKISGDNSKITFPSDYESIHDKKTWEYWIPNCLITGILKEDK